MVLWVSLMGFLALTILSYITSTTRNYGLDEVLRDSALVLLFLWMLGRSRGDGADAFTNRFVQVLSMSTLLACGIGFLVYVLQPVNRFTGTFFDWRFHTDYWPNAFAEYLLLAWPVVLYWALRDFDVRASDVRSRIELLVRAGVIGIVLGSLALTYSRGALLVFALQILLWALLIMRKVGCALPWQRIVPVAILAVAVSFLTFVSGNALRSQYYEVQEVSEKVTFSADEGVSSFSERAQFFEQALGLTFMKPFLGFGPYSFRFVQPRYERGVLETSDHPHNVLLKLAMERGVLAALLFALAIGWVLVRTARAFLSEEVGASAATFSLRLFLFLGVLGVLLHNLMDYNLQFTGLAIPLWIALALLVAPLPLERFRAVPADTARRAAVFLATVLLLVAFVEGMFLVTSSLGRCAEREGRIEAALRFYSLSRGEFFSRDLHLSRAKLLLGARRFQGAGEAVDVYMSENAEDHRAWRLRGEIAFGEGEYERALASFERAYALGHRNDLGSLRGYIETALAMERRDLVDAKRGEFDALLEEYAEALERNAHFVALGPNVSEFIEIADALAVLYPEDAPRYQVHAARADMQARMERRKISARPPGFLW